MPSDLAAPETPISFYAPLKAPDDPVPSGDRTLARLLLRALAASGYGPVVASTFRAFSAEGGSNQERLLEAGAREAERVARALGALPAGRRPRLWFTYHSYYKAPDLLGPAVSQALGIPYAIAEASHAAKRAHGPFTPFHSQAAEAARRADLHLVLNRRDREGLAQLRGGEQGLLDLPPFVDARPGNEPAPIGTEGPLRLAAVAMMRPGDKLSSFRLLAEALGQARADWRLEIAGDGAAREEVERLFRPHGGRVQLHGLVTDPARLQEILRGSDLLVWPGVNEAFGMIYLEAAAEGRSALAMRWAGVPEVVEAGVSGLLTEPGDAAGFAAAIDALAGDRALVRRLGAGALERARGHHGFAATVGRLRAALQPLIHEEPAPCAS